MKKSNVLASLGILATLVFGCTARGEEAKPAEVDKVKAALPEQAPAKPQKDRKILIFSVTNGFHHDSIPIGAEAIRLMGEKTGAYQAVVSDDLANFEKDKLAGFDAVVMNNTTGDVFLPRDMGKLPKEQQDAAKKQAEQYRQNLAEFVKGGKGLVGVHAATDCLYDWAEYGQMMGGYFDGHPWNEKVTVKIDDPASPITQMFGGKSFEVADEIYQMRDPYSRQKLHELLSLDVEKTNMTKGGIKRTDKDFAVSWIHEVGQGRVFYCSLGHRHEIFWTPDILKHYLAGIQYALGDLKADATPSQK